MTSLLLDLVRQGLPHVPLNKGVLQANTDTFLDALPLLTMLPCLSVSWGDRKHRRASVRVTRPRARPWAAGCRPPPRGRSCRCLPLAQPAVH